jgi:CRP-like cAMP-binding protein
MAVAERLERLRATALFRTLDDDALALVASLAKEFEAKPGQVLTEPGQPGTGMFVITDGSARADVRGGPPRTLHAGECFGELALLIADGTRTARVCAETPVRCLAIARDDFRHLLEREPRIAVSLLEVLAERLAR